MASTHQAIVQAMQRLDWTAPPLKPIARPISHRQGLTARMHALETSHGGVKAAAQAAGVTPRTWRGWATNPRARLSRKSAQGLEQAYQDDLDERSADPLRQRRYALGKAKDAQIKITAEIQWDGYYNGQAQTVAVQKPEEPLPPEVNGAAHRTVDFGVVDIGNVWRAWQAGRDTFRPMARDIRRAFGAYVFPNSFHQGATVEITL